MNAMAIIVKSSGEIELMRQAGRIAAGARSIARQMVEPGVSTKAINKEVFHFIKKSGAEPTFLGYCGYPASVCISVNDQVIHGIPGSRRLQEGDIVSLDAGLIYKGYHSDAARTHAVGKVSPEVQKLMDVTREALEAGIAAAVCGNYIRDISAAIQKVAKKNGIAVVRDFVGHGCGVKLHEPPEVPNYVTPLRGPRLQPGMVLAIEPMFNLGTYKVYVESNQWTVRTRDGRNSAHFEHMVLITTEQPEVLTRA